jgi:hypothetical protein
MTNSRYTVALQSNGHIYLCDASSSTDREFYARQAEYLAVDYPQHGVTYRVLDISGAINASIPMAPKRLRPWA